MLKGCVLLGSVAMVDSFIGYDMGTGERVALPYSYRDRHTTIIGKTGFGKTTLLEHLILADLQNGTSCIVIDAEGDLTERIISLAPRQAHDRIMLVEAWEDRPFRLNLFACPNRQSSLAVDFTTGSIVHLFKRLFGTDQDQYEPRLERNLGSVARTVIANDGTMLDVPRLFSDLRFRQHYLANVTNRYVHDFWGWYDRLGTRPDRQLEQLESTVNRLHRFLSSELVQCIVGSRETTIPFAPVATHSWRCGGSMIGQSFYPPKAPVSGEGICCWASDVRTTSSS
jgi:hypothetical protein